MTAQTRRSFAVGYASTILLSSARDDGFSEAADFWRFLSICAFARKWVVGDVDPYGFGRGFGRHALCARFSLGKMGL